MNYINKNKSELKIRLVNIIYFMLYVFLPLHTVSKEFLGKLDNNPATQTPIRFEWPSNRSVYLWIPKEI